MALVLTNLPASLQDLLHEIEAVDPEMFTPQTAIRPNEKVLGMAPLFARKCFALAMHYTREQERAALDLKYTKVEADKFELGKIIQRAHQISKLLSTLQWYIINEGYPVYGHDLNPGLRVGWAVVLQPEDDGTDLFRRLFGGR